MKQVLVICWLILSIFSSLAQRDLTPGKKEAQHLELLTLIIISIQEFKLQAD